MTFISKNNISCHECNGLLITNSHELICSQCGLIHDDIQLKQSKNFDVNNNNSIFLYFILNSKNTRTTHLNLRISKYDKWLNGIENSYWRNKQIIQKLCRFFNLNEKIKRFILNDMNYYLSIYFKSINSVYLTISIFYYHFTRLRFRVNQKRFFSILKNEFKFHINFKKVNQILIDIGLKKELVFSKESIQDYFNSSINILIQDSVFFMLKFIDLKELRVISIQILNMIKNKLTIQNYKYYIVSILFHVCNSLIDKNYFKKSKPKPFQMTKFQDIFNIKDSTIYRYSHKIIEMINTDY